MSAARFGHKSGPLWWNYDLSAAVRFNDAVGIEVRWWGITIGRWGFGIMRRVR